MNRFRIATGLAVAFAAVSLGTVAAFATTSHTPNWTTHTQGNKEVVCGIAPVYGTAFDSGVMGNENGLWPGLLCEAEGLRNPHPSQGDPAVTLGQGSAGRAKLIDTSQDEYTSTSSFKRMPSHANWSKDGITCTINPAQVICHNSSGHGFTLSKDHLKLH
jgi:hypothetical protein